MRVVNEDAAKWLERAPDQYDVILIDFPDPSSFALGKLYSVPMYRLVARHLAAGGRIVVQSTSPYFAPNAFWCIEATLRAAGLYTWPYHVYVPSFGEWGFILAGADEAFALPENLQVATRFLSPQELAAMFRFPADMARRAVEPNFLNTQKLVQYFEQDWGEVMR